jgi:hypothetical protein
MACYLLTVQSAHRSGDVLQVMPRVPMQRLIDQEPGLMTPMPGDPLQLRLPDGSVRAAQLGSFGIEAWERDGELYTTSDPSRPELTLTLAGGLGPDDLPPGTEVWLADPEYQS